MVGWVVATKLLVVMVVEGVEFVVEVEVLLGEEVEFSHGVEWVSWRGQFLVVLL